MVKFLMQPCPNCYGKGGVCVGLGDHLEPQVANCPVCRGRGCQTVVREMDEVLDKEVTMHFIIPWDEVWKPTWR